MPAIIFFYCAKLYFKIEIVFSVVYSQTFFVVMAIFLFHLKSEPLIFVELGYAKNPVWVFAKALETIMWCIKEEESPNWHKKNKSFINPSVFRLSVPLDKSLERFTVRIFHCPNLFFWLYEQILTVSSTITIALESLFFDTISPYHEDQIKRSFEYD